MKKKFHTVKFVKISMKFSHQEKFMKFCISSYSDCVSDIGIRIPNIKKKIIY